MLTSFIKFIHLLAALGLLGLTISCWILVGAKNFSDLQNDIFSRFNKIILSLGALAMVTGTLLVYPKHFTFHTPWIQAAYLLLLIFCGMIFSLLLYKTKRKNSWIWRCIYFVAIIILIGIVRDAVMKTTFL